MVAGVAVFGCFMMATMASVSAQQIGNLQGQPSNAPSTPGTGKPTRANPAPFVIACSGAFTRDSHHLKLTMAYDGKNVDFGGVDAGPGKSIARSSTPVTQSVGSNLVVGRGQAQGPFSFCDEWFFDLDGYGRVRLV